MVIHPDHKLLQFIQAQVKLQNDCHYKWSSYLQKFHLNIKYKKGGTNHVVDCLIRTPMETLTIMLDSCCHEISAWFQLYNYAYEFTSTYRALYASTLVTKFHHQDRLLCYLSHIYVPSNERAKLIWEAHYSQVAGHFGMEKEVALLQRYFYWSKLH